MITKRNQACFAELATRGLQEVMFWGRYRFLRARYFIIVETNGAEPFLTRDSGGVYYFSSGGLMALNMR